MLQRQAILSRFSDCTMMAANETLLEPNKVLSMHHFTGSALFSLAYSSLSKARRRYDPDSLQQKLLIPWHFMLRQKERLFVACEQLERSSHRFLECSILALKQKMRELVADDEKSSHHGVQSRSFAVAPSAPSMDGKYTNTPDLTSIDCASKIKQVLLFWFGQHEPDDNQKKLWMTAHSSPQQAALDRKIHDMFGTLLEELSNSDAMLDSWCQGEYHGKVATIIVLDQFSRHIHRCLESLDSRLNIPPQSDLDCLALKVAVLVRDEHAKEIACCMIPIPFYIFSLLPFRHANRMDTVKYVQEEVERMEYFLPQLQGMVRRFRKATNRRMAVLQDADRRMGDASKTGYTDEDILEVFPFESDHEHVEKHPVFRCFCAFLETIDVVSDGEQTTPIITSLSGGVDSMVIVSVLALLQKHGYNLHLVAVHIDYGNRPESAAEARYVEKYATSLGVSCRVRRIDEVTRGIAARDDYERIARSIRFEAYRDAIVECKEEFGDSVTDVGVMLGHHRGDLRENVLSNAHKGAGPIELSGMTVISKNDGLSMFRPLLPLEKDSIYDYAHTYGVPYFKDTTPHWSTRGKLRNKLLPLLEEIYGEGSMNNLSNLALESDHCRELLKQVAFNPFLDQVCYVPMGMHFGTRQFKNQGLFFWKFVLREMLHAAGVGMFGEKSVVTFLERIQSNKLRDGWLQCRKDCAIYLQSDGRAHVFYNDFFPWNKKDAFIAPEKLVIGHEVKVGAWVVSASVVKSRAHDESRSELLSRRAVTSFETFMLGSLSYFIEVPYNGDHLFDLEFAAFTKANRPKAWKGLDLKLQEILPLVTNGDQALTALGELRMEEDAKTPALVRVSLRLDKSFEC